MNRSASSSLESTPVVIRTSAPSYIKSITRCDDDIRLIYRNVVDEETEKCSPTTKVEEPNASLDLTGNPLEVDLNAGDCTLNVSDVCAVNLWEAVEDQYGSLDLKTVRKAINSELTKRCMKDNVYVYGLVNGKTKDKLVVLGAHQTAKTLSRTQVFIDNIFIVDDEVNQKLVNMKKEHVKNACISNEQTKITHQIRGTYVLYGHKISHSPLLFKSQCSGSVSCDVTWTTFCYPVPQYVDLVEMTLQTITGHRNSQLHSYWNNLVLLKSYIDILSKQWDDLGSVVLNKPSKDLDEIVASYDTIIDSTVGVWKPPPSKEKSELKFGNLRWELFTDKLWKLLIYCDTVNGLNFCLHSLFEELVASGFSLNAKQFPTHDTSFILKILIETSNGRMAVPTLSANQALSCLIELGIEKLKKDYFYILDYCNCMSQEQAVEYWESTIQQDKALTTAINPKSTSRKTVGKVRFTVDPTSLLSLPNILNKYNCLVSMHVASDILVLVLNMPSIQPSLAEQIRCRLSNGQMNVNVSSNALFEVKVTLDNKALKDIKLSNPVSWNIKFSSRNKRDTTETIFHHTTKKLFPPGVYDYFETSNDAGDGGVYYYVTKLVCYIKELL